MKRLIIVLIVMLFTTNLMAQTQFKEYSNPEKGIERFVYPESWTEESNPATVFIFIRPLESQGQIFRENVNLVLGSSQGLTLEQYTEASLNQLHNYMEGFQKVSSEYVQYGDNKFSKITYKHNMTGLPLKVDFYILMKGDKCYNITCSALVSSYDEYESLFSEMLKQMEVK